jgi:pre-mRNA-splicing factor CDC5/CEF1
MPELEENEPEGERPLEEDAADADKRRERQEQERLEAEKRKRSQAVQQGLPRPAIPQTMVFQPSYGPGGGDGPGQANPAVAALLEQAESLLHEEMAALVTRDAFLFPTKGAKPPKKPVEIAELPGELLDSAKKLLEAEAERSSAASGGDIMVGGAIQATLEDSAGHLAYLPEAKRYVEWPLLGKNERMEAAKHMFNLAESTIQRESKRAKKLEEKMDRVLGGFMMKVKQATKKISAFSEERETINTETEVFRTLSLREEKAIESRVEELENAVESEKQRNAKLQHKYKELKRLGEMLDDRLQ